MKRRGGRRNSPTTAGHEPPFADAWFWRRCRQSRVRLSSSPSNRAVTRTTTRIERRDTDTPDEVVHLIKELPIHGLVRAELRLDFRDVATERAYK